MADYPVHHFQADDGERLAYRELGQGVPLILIHGLFSNGWTNWIRYGHADLIAAKGFRVIMPDLRGHGESAAPHDPAAYPPDVLMQDGLALVRHLGVEADYRLAGYSLGGRTALRMLVKGARPKQAVLCGMGLQGIIDTGGRVGFFREVLEGVGTHKRLSPQWMAEAFLKTTGGDPQAMLPLLDSFVSTTEAELDSIDLPVRVVCGVDDHDNGSAEALADRLPHGSFAAIPGNHMSAVLKAELGREIADFLEP
ncbi:alpha/beta fold hydrolase [Sphingomonas naphthae]|uniref:Alpha/beta fold hydrolase n=1 Tax=Sphingomonas naphthae TaxID=1813468 RepID=A0ABY7TQ81_9SPHN|nr:alpha/beta hydrolase [Sphingomonas naphthae]WCT75393.1 alpha/beta fold hydrolase [Sphingomonas naphthae]